MDGRTIRRSLNQTGRYTRQPNNNPESQNKMEEHGVGYSSSGLVAQMREQGNVWQQGDVSVKLAKAYGYCWGVERAVRMAYEAKRSFPDKKLFITNEIIHNPEVNTVRRSMTPWPAPALSPLQPLCLAYSGPVLHLCAVPSVCSVSVRWTSQ